MKNRIKDRKYYLTDLKCVRETDGMLIAAESGTQIPFPIQRMFCVKEVGKDQTRGAHATKKTRLVLIALAGSCEIEVDTGDHKEVFVMNTPSKGLYIDAMIWRTMKNFSPDCLVLALADRIFDAQDETYDDYEEFVKAVHVLSLAEEGI